MALLIILFHIEFPQQPEINTHDNLSRSPLYSLLRLPILFCLLLLLRSPSITLSFTSSGSRLRSQRYSFHLLLFSHLSPQTTFYTTQQPCQCPPSFSNRACPSTSPKDPSRSICRPRGQLKRHASSLSSAASKAWPFPKVSRLAWEDLGLVMESSSRIRCWIACWYVSIKARVEAFVVLVVLDGGKRLRCACSR